MPDHVSPGHRAYETYVRGVTDRYHRHWLSLRDVEREAWENVAATAVHQGAAVAEAEPPDTFGSDAYAAYCRSLGAHWCDECQPGPLDWHELSDDERQAWRDAAAKAIELAGGTGER